MTRLRKEILTVLQTKNKPLDWKGLAIEVSGNRTDIIGDLSAMHALGFVLRDGVAAGVANWTLTDAGRDALKEAS
jgi:hypothetical protein